MNPKVKKLNGRILGFPENGLLAYESGIESDINIIFVGGLGDTMLSLDFIEELDAFCRANEYNFIILQLRSQPNFRMRAIDDDIEDIHSLLEIIDGKHVLIGHSTGCQDVLLYMGKHKNPNVQGIILQAPVSDIEALDDEQLKITSDILAKFPKSNSLYEEIFGKIWLKERFISLYTKEGKEDLFSSYLSDEEYAKWGRLGVKILSVISEKDEFCKKDVSSKLNLMGELQVIMDADHGLTRPGNADNFISIISEFIKKI